MLIKRNGGIKILGKRLNADVYWSRRKKKNKKNSIFSSSLNNIFISRPRISPGILEFSRTRNNSANRTGSAARIIWLHARSMETAIREVAVDFSGRNRAFIKHTLLYYINDIDSKKHNQPRDLLPPPRCKPTPFDLHCGRVCSVCACVISRARTHAHTNARAALSLAPLLLYLH